KDIAKICGIAEIGKREIGNRLELRIVDKAARAGKGTVPAKNGVVSERARVGPALQGKQPVVGSAKGSRKGHICVKCDGGTERSDSVDEEIAGGEGEIPHRPVEAGDISRG